MADRLGNASLGPARTVDETDRYLDTDDGRLASARWACRLRLRDGTTRISLKGPPSDAPAAAWHHRRPEVEGPATDEIAPNVWPASEARDLARVARRRARPDGAPAPASATDRASGHARWRRADRHPHPRPGAVGRRRRRPGELFVVELELDPTSRCGEAELSGLADALASVPGPRARAAHEARARPRTDCSEPDDDSLPRPRTLAEWLALGAGLAVFATSAGTARCGTHASSSSCTSSRSGRSCGLVAVARARWRAAAKPGRPAAARPAGGVRARHRVRPEPRDEPARHGGHRRPRG